MKALTKNKTSSTEKAEMQKSRNVKIVALLVAVLVASNLVFAQNGIPERLLLTTGQYLGPGARAQGLAGTYTGIADDFSAVWWNPAGLAQIKRIEIQGSLSRSGFVNNAAFTGRLEAEGSTNEIRVNNLGVVFPVPVYQGALSFAVGYSQALAFDRHTITKGGGEINPDFNELESGRLGFWTFASAVDVSPNLALGAGLQYWSGIDEYTYIENSGTLQVTEETIVTDLGAWGANLGALYRAGRFGRIGAMFQTPMSVKLDESWVIDGDDGHFDYRMTNPAVFRLGGSIAPGRWLAAADIEYRDWTSLEFRSETPYAEVTKAAANQEIKDQYKATTRISLGGEYLFPAYGLRGRAGYSFAPSNYRGAGGEDDRSIMGLGLSLLVDRSVMLDASYNFTSFTEKVTDGLTEDIRSNAGLFTLSWRL